MLGLRVLSSLILIPILAAAGWFGSPWSTLVVAAFVLGAAYELFDLSEKAGFRPFRLTGIFLSLLFLGSAAWQTSTGQSPLGLLLAFGTLLVITIRLFRREAVTHFADWAVTLSGALYCGWPLAHWVLLRDGVDGGQWVVYGLFATFASDTSAFLIGRTWGRHPLAPAVSPKKSVEGAIAAFIGTMAASVGLVLVLGLPVSILAAALLGLAVSFAAQCGDLAESALKRAANVKDAGLAIPGHGGVLDRADSLIFVGVVVYYLHGWLH